MRQKPSGRQSSSERVIRDIKRKTRKQYSAEEKIRIVLDGQWLEEGKSWPIAETFREISNVCFWPKRDLPF